MTTTKERLDDLRRMNNDKVYGSKSDLFLLDIIDKLKAALEWYAHDQQFDDGTLMTDKQKRDMDDYGGIARRTLKKIFGEENE